jgi:hypothetical protein
MMFSTPDLSRVSDKLSLYAGLHSGIAAILEGERDFIANTAAMLFHTPPTPPLVTGDWE